MKFADIEVGKAYAKGSPASFKGSWPQATYALVLEDQDPRYYQKSNSWRSPDKVTIPPVPFVEYDENGETYPLTEAYELTAKSTREVMGKGELRVLIVQTSSRPQYIEGTRTREYVEYVNYAYIGIVKSSQLRMPWDEYLVLKAEKDAEMKAHYAAKAREDEARELLAKRRREHSERLNELLASTNLAAFVVNGKVCITGPWADLQDAAELVANA